MARATGWLEANYQPASSQPVARAIAANLTLSSCAHFPARRVAPICQRPLGLLLPAFFCLYQLPPGHLDIVEPWQAEQLRGAARGGFDARNVGAGDGEVAHLAAGARLQLAV